MKLIKAHVLSIRGIVMLYMCVERAASRLPTNGIILVV